jgi:hypothetical protein
MPLYVFVFVLLSVLFPVCGVSTAPGMCFVYVDLTLPANVTDFRVSHPMPLSGLTRASIVYETLGVRVLIYEDEPFRWSMHCDTRLPFYDAFRRRVRGVDLFSTAYAFFSVLLNFAFRVFEVGLICPLVRYGREFLAPFYSSVFQFSFQSILVPTFSYYYPIFLPWFSLLFLLAVRIKKSYNILDDYFFRVMKYYEFTRSCFPNLFTYVCFWFIPFCEEVIKGYSDFSLVFFLFLEFLFRGGFHSDNFSKRVNVITFHLALTWIPCFYCRLFVHVLWNFILWNTGMRASFVDAERMVRYVFPDAYLAVFEDVSRDYRAIYRVCVGERVLFRLAYCGVREESLDYFESRFRKRFNLHLQEEFVSQSGLHVLMGFNDSWEVKLVTDLIIFFAIGARCKDVYDFSTALLVLLHNRAGDLESRGYTLPGLFELVQRWLKSDEIEADRREQQEELARQVAAQLCTRALVPSQLRTEPFTAPVWHAPPLVVTADTPTRADVLRPPTPEPEIEFVASGAMSSDFAEFGSESLKILVYS